MDIGVIDGQVHEKEEGKVMALCNLRAATISLRASAMLNNLSWCSPWLPRSWKTPPSTSSFADDGSAEALDLEELSCLTRLRMYAPERCGSSLWFGFSTSMLLLTVCLEEWLLMSLNGD
ncbi:hypothetical protein MUK42_15807 [Musa troglodytarum]|uniref:Uncharacterized protein n=1 Tax=Musa troglodytarum TaxID=320322 RepID=A0A9E7KRI2_9LILI|nr:hypothetical protein MUK42_15807 [Musa troglodytarum]